MNSLIIGAIKFMHEDFLEQKDLFEQLSSFQNPHTLFIGCSDKPRSPVRYRGKAAAIPHPRADRRGLSSFFAPGRGQALGNFLQLVGEFSVKTHKTSGFIPVIMQQNAQKRVYILRVILYYKDRIPLRQFI